VAKVLELARAIALPVTDTWCMCCRRNTGSMARTAVREPLGMVVGAWKRVCHIVTAAARPAKHHQVLQSVRPGSRGHRARAAGFRRGGAGARRKDLGVALVDIGGGTTDIAIITEGGGGPHPA